MFDHKSELQLFLLIYENKSLSAAAQVLRITPAMASKRLAHLEKDMGTRLFHRTTRRVQPTEEGAKFYLQAQSLLETMATFEEQWHERQEPSGLVRVTASASFGRLYLVPLICRFMKKFPRVQVHLELTDKMLDIVAEGYDLAVRIGTLADSTLVAKRLGSGRRAIVATPQYLAKAPPLRKPRDLEQHSCITFNDKVDWEFGHGAHRTSVRIQGSFSTNYGEAMVQAIKAHMGIGIVSRWHMVEELKKGQLVSLLEDYDLSESPSIYAVYPSRKLLPQKTRVLLEFLEEELNLP